MAGDQERCCSLLQFVAVVLLLFSLVPGLTCFSLRGLRRKGQQEELVGEAAGNIRGRILFNGKELNFQSRASSVAAKASGLAHVDSAQSDDTGLQGQTLQLETDQEAAWRRLNPTLSCGQTRMKLKAMGPGAAGLQLDMGVFNGIARTLPLIQVPNSCGYSMQRNALGLILVVPYDGCSVVQENGYYVLPLSWLKNPIQLACPTSQHLATTATMSPVLQSMVPLTTTSTTTTSQPVSTTRQPATTTEPATTTTTPVVTTGNSFIQPSYSQNLIPSTASSQQSGTSVTAASASTPACPNKISSSRRYLDLMSQYNAYNWLPFNQYMWHKNMAGNFPYAWKYQSQPGYLPGVQAPVQPFPGFLYQQPMPWFSYSSGPKIPQLN